jgi:hypothetical protein
MINNLQRLSDNMSIVVRQYPLGFTRMCLHFLGYTREKRATGKKVKIAVAQVDLAANVEYDLALDWLQSVVGKVGRL